MRPIDAYTLNNELVSWYNDTEDETEKSILRRVMQMVVHAPTPPNEPLTMEQLREMDGEPVWLDVADGVWALVDTDDDCVWLDRGGSIDIYKLTGKVYRRPPEGADAHPD